MHAKGGGQGQYVPPSLRGRAGCARTIISKQLGWSTLASTSTSFMISSYVAPSFAGFSSGLGRCITFTA